MTSNPIFCLPLTYLTISRLKTVREWVSWAYLFPLYCFFAYAVSMSAFPDVNFLIFFFCVFMPVISLYEIGYVYNDTKSSKKELNPTVRVSENEIRSSYNLIIFSRLFYVIFFSLILLFFRTKFDVSYSFVEYLILMALLGVAFCMHNFVRGSYNLLTFLILSFFKYLCVLFAVDSFGIIVITFFSFTFLRAIEYGSIKRYLNSNVSSYVNESRDRFRVVYYLILAIFTYFTVAFGFAKVSTLYCVLYFFIYRLGIFLLTFRAQIRA